MDSILDSVLFRIGETVIELKDLVAVGIFLLVAFLGLRLLKKYILPLIFRDQSNEKKFSSRLIRWVFYAIMLALGVVVLRTMDFDDVLISHSGVLIKYSTVLIALIVIQIARILDWIINKAYIENFIRQRDAKEVEPSDSLGDNQQSAHRTIQWIVYVTAAIIIFSQMNFNPHFEVRKSVVAENTAWSLHLTDVLQVILILLIARILVWLFTQVILYRYYKRNKINQGDQYAFNRLLKYVIYVFAAIISLNHVGINTTLILGGAAALLVGLGLGLQQTFNDFFSGILLLFERRIELGDVVKVEDDLGRVTKIGLRTTTIRTRDDIALIIPNSKLVNDNVINYSEEGSKARFSIRVGVKYGSDPKLVERLLLDATKEDDLIYQHPSPSVIFKDFGDSSLMFELNYFISDFIREPMVASKMRSRIAESFAQHGLSIPFPQREVWLKKPNE